MKRKKIFWGVFLILAAIFVIVNKLGYFAEINPWSMLFTIFLIAIIIKSIFKFRISGILFPLAFLCIIYAKPLNITAITPWPVLLAATLGSIGISMLFSKRNHNRHWFNREKQRIIGGNYDDENKLHVAFGQSVKYVNDCDFKHADIECSFGSLKVYFDNAIITQGHAAINLEASFAGVELYVPKSWNIIRKASPFCANVKEEDRNNELGTIDVYLEGDWAFSEVAIFYI